MKKDITQSIEFPDEKAKDVLIEILSNGASRMLEKAVLDIGTQGKEKTPRNPTFELHPDLRNPALYLQKPHDYRR